jgi:hypothetical protein
MRPLACGEYARIDPIPNSRNARPSCVKRSAWRCSSWLSPAPRRYREHGVTIRVDVHHSSVALQILPQHSPVLPRAIAFYKPGPNSNWWHPRASAPSTVPILCLPANRAPRCPTAPAPRIRSAALARHAPAAAVGSGSATNQPRSSHPRKGSLPNATGLVPLGSLRFVPPFSLSAVKRNFLLGSKQLFTWTRHEEARPSPLLAEADILIR